MRSATTVLLVQAGACALLASSCELDFEARGLEGSGTADAAPGDGGLGRDAGSDACGGQCGPCFECLPSGTCKVRSAGSECGGEIDCTAFVKELVTGADLSGCFAYQGRLVATCDPTGVCVHPTKASCEAQPRGDLIAVCNSRCVRDAHRCVQGMPIGEVSVGSLCVINEPSPACNRSRCIDDPDGAGSIFEEDRCNVAGECVRAIRDCENYRCADQASCKLSCTTGADCVNGIPCSSTGVCTTN